MTVFGDLPLVLTAEEFAPLARVSRWQVYESVKRGEIKATRLGRCLRIPRSECARLLGLSDDDEAGGKADPDE